MGPKRLSQPIDEEPAKRRKTQETKYRLPEPYVIISKIGYGVSSTVYKCLDKSSNRHVAVKVIGSKNRGLEMILGAHARETAILDMLKKKAEEAHIVAYEKHFVHEDCLCIVFELLSANLHQIYQAYVDTATIFHSQGGFPISYVGLIAKQLLRTLHYLSTGELLDQAASHRKIKDSKQKSKENENNKEQEQEQEQKKKINKRSGAVTLPSFNLSSQIMSKTKSKLKAIPKVKSGKESINNARGKFDSNGVLCKYKLLDRSSKKMGAKTMMTQDTSNKILANQKNIAKKDAAHKISRKVTVKVNINKKTKEKEDDEEREDKDERNKKDNENNENNHYSRHSSAKPKKTLTGEMKDVGLFDNVNKTASRWVPIVHGDIKPTNIGVKYGDPFNFVTFDFGLSYKRFVSKNQQVQTYNYRAPEVVLSTGEPYGPEIDMWSLGCILAEMFTGTYLFTMKNEATNIREENLWLSVLQWRILGPIPDRLISLHIQNCKGVSPSWFSIGENGYEYSNKDYKNKALEINSLFGHLCFSESFSKNRITKIKCNSSLTHQATYLAEEEKQEKEDNKEKEEEKEEEGDEKQKENIENTKSKEERLYIAFEDLLRNMLCYEPQKRIKPFRALSHPFFSLLPQITDEEKIILNDSLALQEDINSGNNNEDKRYPSSTCYQVSTTSDQVVSSCKNEKREEDDNDHNDYADEDDKEGQEGQEENKRKEKEEIQKGKGTEIDKALNTAMATPSAQHKDGKKKPHSGIDEKKTSRIKGESNFRCAGTNAAIKAAIKGARSKTARTKAVIEMKALSVKPLKKRSVIHLSAKQDFKENERPASVVSANNMMAYPPSDDQPHINTRASNVIPLHQSMRSKISKDASSTNCAHYTTALSALDLSAEVMPKMTDFEFQQFQELIIKDSKNKIVGLASKK